MAVPQFRGRGVHPREWYDRRLCTLRAAGPRGQCMVRHKRRTRSIPTESCRLSPLQPISYRSALPIPSLHSFATSALATADQGALWAAGIGPQVLLKIQNGKIVIQLRDRPVDCAYRDPNGVVWLATPPPQRFNLVLTNPPYVRHHHLQTDDKIPLEGPGTNNSATVVTSLTDSVYREVRY